MTQQKVNIIIPVHNRLDLTRQTLETLVKNTPANLYTLHIVNDGSDKETSDYLKKFMEDGGVHGTFSTLITNDEAISPGASRNKAWELIKKDGEVGEFVYHSDNDVYFTEGWLQKLIKVIQMAEKDGVLLLGGGCHPYLQNNDTLQYNVLTTGEGGTHNETCIVGIKDAVSGYSQLMRTETWEKYGPFDESMRGQEKKIAGSEDWAFCQKIVKDGFKVGSIEPEVVHHCGKTNTYGEPATGSETFKDFTGVKVI